ncbi:hypothetical protein [Kamptonema sp. UHCC 0994]|uniref:hypothetical protein n=1 Tax=Kamptonema sp. UHCC 0994 TaxID=3031329 RepID=UPI0023B9CAED|nr:hypothetical protein [Kamptonema sp. UHCC 0994]MDF0554059.1 hypothetical protein [Kamptonema sp. UHCC 0994]
MATSSSDNTLLALLLALKTLKTPLTETERAKLYEVGEQLELDPDDWEFIREGLIAIISDNPSLNENFQDILTHLNTLDGNQERQLLPTGRELAQVNPIDNSIERRGYDEGEPEFESLEILNTSQKVAQKVLKGSNPVVAARELNWLERIIKTFLPPAE